MSFIQSSVRSDQLLLWAANVAIHVTVLTAVSLLVALLFRRAAAMRYWVLCLGMLLVLCSPLISAVGQSRGDGWLALSLPSDEIDIVEEAKPALSPKNMDDSSFLITEELPTPNFSTRAVSPNAELPVAERFAAAPSDLPNQSIDVTSKVTAAPIAKSRSMTDWLRVLAVSLMLAWAIGSAVFLLRMLVGWVRLAGSFVEPNRS